MILTKKKQVEIIAKLTEWISRKSYYIELDDFEDMISHLMKTLSLDSYSNTRQFCKEWIERRQHEIAI